MNSLSVVIITRNEEQNIVDCIRSARSVSDDIVVVDSGSEDQTIHLASKCGARIFSIDWKGYGASRNIGAAKARHNWILALDADERITNKLAAAINALQLTDTNCIYGFRRKNFLANRELRFGTLGFEAVKRLYNRSYTRWDLTLVHEKLISDRPQKKMLCGHIEHYGLKSTKQFKARAFLYAQMSAEKYFSQRKKVSSFKKYFSPLFNSAKSYFFQLGFLDGRNGWTVAKTIAYYSWLKYCFLEQLNRKEKTPKKSQAILHPVKSV